MTDRVGQQFGNYQLVQLLGHGGSAEVYLGKHRYLNSYAALKVLHASIHPGNEHKFLAEAQRLVDLRHPNIIHLLDFAIENETPVLIMDYASNGSVRQRYPHGTQMPLPTVVDFVSQIAAALQYAHNHHVIHRDVKPENILLDTNNRLLLSDFGLSLQAPSLQELSTQDPAGTARYMAPEQLQGKPSFASDQYALAIMAYEWLCGDLPFRGNIWEIWHQHLYTAPPPLRTIRPELPLRLEKIILRALAKKPQDRFVSILAFARALERACQTDTPVDENISQVTAPLQILPRPSPTTPPHHLSPQKSQIALISTKPLPKTQPAPSRVSTLQNQNRVRMLRRLRRSYSDLMSQSLQGTTWLELGLADKPDAVQNAANLLLHVPNRAEQHLPRGTSIKKAYDEAEHELLILGDPGTGKSTLLLDLSLNLLTQAEQDPTHPLPVILPLSSWAVKRAPLEDWITEQLAETYYVPRKLSAQWVREDNILPLLDGLDEMEENARPACIAAINTYHRDHLAPLVVCSRTNEYEAATESHRLALQGAVIIQPLTHQDVDAYLVRAGQGPGQASPLAALQSALKKNAALRNLATTPLMLNILILTYYEQSGYDSLVKTSPDDLQRLVFAAYIERMLERRRAKSRYTSQQTIFWLTWLSHQMKQHNQTQFLIERMQMDWLPKNVWYQLSPSIVIGLLIGFVATLNYTLGTLLFTGLPKALLLGLFFGSLTGTMYAILNGLVFGLLGTKDLAEKPVGTLPKSSWAKIRRNGVQSLGNGLTYGLIFGIFFGSLYWWISPAIYIQDYVAIPIFRLSVGLYNGLMNAVNFGSLGKLNPAIQPAETFVWSWGNMRRDFPKYLACGLLLGCVFGISIAYTPLGFIGGLSVGLLFGLIFGSFYSFHSGLSNKLQDERNLTRPNQGIWRSARNSFSTALISASISGLLAGTVFGFLFGSLRADVGLASGITTGISTLLSVGTIVGLKQGGNACIQHFLLRWHLWRAGSIPWNYPQFLDHAAERILLHKVGGSYIFVHRLLLDYFAGLETATTSDISESPTQLLHS